MLGLTAGLTAAAAGVMLRGRLPVGTHPLEFVRGTVVWRWAEYLNVPGREGFDVVEFFVEPAVPEGVESPVVYDHGFASETRRYAGAVRGLPGVRNVYSILDTVGDVSDRSFGLPFPESREQLAAAFLFYIESNLEPGLARQFFGHDGGFRLSVATAADSGVDLGALCDRALGAARSFPGLRVRAFGKLAQYPRVDTYITLGKPLNALWSQVTVVALCGLWVWFSLGGRGIGSMAAAARTGAVMSVPFLFASAALVPVMAGLDMPLDIATSAIGAITVSAAVDFSIYYVHDYLAAGRRGDGHDGASEATTRGEGRLILGDMVLNMLCFVPLMASAFLPVERLGWMMVPMLALSGAGTLVVMPPLLSWAVGATLGPAGSPT